MLLLRMSEHHDESSGADVDVAPYMLHPGQSILTYHTIHLDKQLTKLKEAYANIKLLTSLHRMYITQRCSHVASHAASHVAAHAPTTDCTSLACPAA